MKIALCVCTRNRPGELRRALASVRGSTLPPAQTLVSDDSGDTLAVATAAVCAGFAEVAYLSGPRKGLSANRNHCLDHLAPEIEAVTFIDDDVVLRPDFLYGAAAEMAAPPPKMIITGRECKNGADVTPHNCSFWGHQEVKPRGPDDHHTVVINASLFPRSLFAVARFDEALRYGSEEADVCAQAEALGYRIRFCPSLVNDHRPSPVNRSEYARVVETSRLYSTYKRYRWLERNLHKAAVYALLAPLHLIASAVKAGRVQDTAAAFCAVYAAFRQARAEGRRRGVRARRGLQKPGKRCRTIR